MDCKVKAREGLLLLEDAVLDALRLHTGGLYNNEIARFLAIESDYEGRSSNYLTYSLLGGLLKDGRVRKEKKGTRTYYFVGETQ